MAITKCKECQKEISTKASSCPHCGAKVKSKNIGCGIVLLVLIVGLIVVNIIDSQITQYNKRVETKKQEEIKKQQNENFEKEKNDFISNIENHYSDLIKLKEQAKIDEAVNKLNLFEKYGKKNFKDINEINRDIKTKSLEEKLKKTPATDINGNLKLYSGLIKLNPNNQTYKSKAEQYQKKQDKYLQDKKENEYKASCQLAILSSRWQEEYDYAIYEGQVKNISNSNLTNVQAVVTWYDKNDNMITSSSALIEYNPILAGQTSPFKVMKTYNPEMKKASIEFSHLMGGTIKSYEER
jgi:hypothetical protein